MVYQGILRLLGYVQQSLKNFIIVVIQAQETLLQEQLSSIITEDDLKLYCWHSYCYINDENSHQDFVNAAKACQYKP